MSRSSSTAKLIGINNLATEHGSPGRAFKLSESELTDLLNRAARESSKIELTSASGISQLAFDGNSEEIAAELLKGHYQRVANRSWRDVSFAIAGDGADLPITDLTLFESAVPS